MHRVFLPGSTLWHAACTFTSPTDRTPQRNGCLMIDSLTDTMERALTLTENQRRILLLTLLTFVVMC